MDWRALAGRTGAGREGERNDAEHEGQRGHQDGAQAQPAGLDGGLQLRIGALRERLLDQLAELEARVDFEGARERRIRLATLDVVQDARPLMADLVRFEKERVEAETALANGQRDLQRVQDAARQAVQERQRSQQAAQAQGLQLAREAGGRLRVSGGGQ